MAEHGDAKMTDLLETLADCPKPIPATDEPRRSLVQKSAALSALRNAHPAAAIRRMPSL
jgi:hypothetical protein